MSGQRKALIVANDQYEQEALRNLLAPAADAEALGRVLGDKQVGDFSVQVVRNEPSYVIQAQIEELFLESLPDDVLLLHFSGHGLKNQSGELFFAATNTRPKLLGSTAVSADFVQRCMRASRSRSIVLLLDCCYGGAFGQGVTVRAAGDVNVLDSFPQEKTGGRGRAVITASNAMEYAFEGDQLADNQHARPSVFTSALVEGLATGDADRDEDGWVSLNELYDYVFEEVRKQNPHQTPSRAVEMQGELYVARSRRRRIRPASLPPDLHAAVTDPNMYSRLGAVSELRVRLASDNLPVAVGAYEALAELARSDIRFVADPAAAALDQAALHPEETELHFGKRTQGSEPPHRMVRLLGPPIARVCVPRPSHDWIRVNETAEGFVISVDTKDVGNLRGSLNLKGPTGEAAVTIDIELTSPPPQAPAVRPQSTPAHGKITKSDTPARPPGSQRAQQTPEAVPAASRSSQPKASSKSNDHGQASAIQPLPPDGGPEGSRLRQHGADEGGMARAQGTETGPGGKGAPAEPTPEAFWMAEGQSALRGKQPWRSAKGRSVPHLRQLQTLQADQKVCAVTFSPDGRWLATGGRGLVRLWDLQTAAAVRELPIGRRNTAKALVFSPDGTRLAASSGQNAHIWDATTGERQLEMAHPGSSVLALAFSPDGTRLSTGGDYHYARIWDAHTGELQLEVTRDVEARPPQGVMAAVSAAVRGKVHAVAFSEDGRWLAFGGRSFLSVWNLQKRAAVHEMPIGQLDTVEALVFSPNGTRLAASSGQKVQIWDATSGQHLEVTHDPSLVLAVAFSPDGTQLATGDSYQSARIWDATTGRQQLELTHDSSPVLTVAFSPDGSQLATGGDKTAQIWELPSRYSQEGST